MIIDNKEDVSGAEENITLYDDRDLILSKLNDAIEYLHHKALTGRIHDAKNEKVRIAWFKTLAYACNVYNTIKRDIEVDELKEEVENLRNQIKNMERGL